ncbi:MAG: FtsX-like permease family protein [Lachnospiraceae bacterium]|jgi:putative ABC transport system permease protein|nr:FtsX-like permease family protein [Lachnospiraceae bacterium]
MKQHKVLPKLAVTGILKNKEAYFPYLAASIFSVFIYFVFASILQNDIMRSLPKAEYILILMNIGLVLLGIILVPFLFYTNSFLIKRRKKELGLYSILGMEKYHIGIMMFYETVVIYLVAVVVGVIFGIVFSKMIFLLLLNMTKLPVDISFPFQIKALKGTLIFFAFVYFLNLITNLLQVGKANPTELLQGGKKGEKELKHLWFPAIIGVVTLGMGYKIAITAQIDEMIFLNFFGAVFLVIIGTYFIFTSGSIVLFKALKKQKHFYYKPKNFVTISGVLYRMKKNAASLVNICIFSTMVIITLLCTISLYIGTDEILEYEYPCDMELSFYEEDYQKEKVENIIETMKQKHSITIEQRFEYTYQRILLEQIENYFRAIPEEGGNSKNFNWVKFFTLEDYNREMKENESLKENEILCFSNGVDFNVSEIKIEEEVFSVKKELKELGLEGKKEENNYSKRYFIIVKDKEILDRITNNFLGRGATNRKHDLLFSISGEEKAREEFAKEVEQALIKEGSFESFSFRNGIENRDITVSMNGGLLFIGIFFGIVFCMCLILILYYKQITEGYEDKDKFEIMQKVGMSDKEVKGTIKRQILLIFFMPLFGAILHTIIAIRMVEGLLAVLYLFNHHLILSCTFIIILTFSIFYLIAYLFTSKTYYRIVQRRI